MRGSTSVFSQTLDFSRSAHRKSKNIYNGQGTQMKQNELPKTFMMISN